MTERPLPWGKKRNPHTNRVFLLQHALYLSKQLQHADSKTRNQNSTKNVLTSIEPYKSTLTASYNKNGLALS